MFIQSLQYWLGGNAENLENLVLNVAGAYTPALKGVELSIMEPQLFPDVGIWHPLAPGASTHFDSAQRFPPGRENWDLLDSRIALAPAACVFS